MAIVSYAALDGVTVGGTELSIVSGTTSLATTADSAFVGLWLDPAQAGMAKGDEFKWRIYEKVEATGGTKRLADWGVMTNIHVEPILVPPLMLLNGWDMTLQKIEGTDRSWYADVRGIDATMTEHAELDGVTVGTSELSVVSGTTSLQTVTDDGFYQLWVDANQMIKGDQFTVRIYEKVRTGATKRQIWEVVLDDVQATLLYSPVLLLKDGWDMTIQRNAGADRTFDAAIRKLT